ncbi:fertilization-influencing membrane protein [Rhynchonycteris naso]
MVKNRWEVVLGSAGRREAREERVSFLRGWEARLPPSSLLCTLLSYLPCPAWAFLWSTQLIFEKFLERNQAPAYSHTKAVWLGRALGLPPPLGVRDRGLLGSCHRLCSGSPAPRPQSAKTLDLGAEFLPFIDRPDFFDYADSDEARLLALAQFIGEKPVSFNSDSKSRLFYRILLGTLVVAFFFLLLQFCAHM